MINSFKSKMVFVIIGQVTPPQEKTLDVISIHIPYMDEISWIHFHPKTFHLLQGDLQNMVKNSMVVDSKSTKWVTNFQFSKINNRFRFTKIGS